MAAIFIGFPELLPATDCRSNFLWESRPEEKAQERSLSVPNTNKTNPGKNITKINTKSL